MPFHINLHKGSKRNCTASKNSAEGERRKMYIYRAPMVVKHWSEWLYVVSFNPCGQQATSQSHTHFLRDRTVPWKMGWSAESPAQLTRAHTLDLPSPPWSECSYFLLKGNLHSIKHPQVLKSALLASQENSFTEESSPPLGNDCIVPCTRSDELWGPHHDCFRGIASRVVIFCLGQGWNPVALSCPTPPLDAAGVTTTSGSCSHTHVCTNDLTSQYPPPSLKVEVHM